MPVVYILLFAIIFIRLFLVVFAHILMERHPVPGDIKKVWYATIILSGIPGMITFFLFLRHIDTSGPVRKNFMPFNPGTISGAILSFLYLQVFPGTGGGILGLVIFITICNGATFSLSNLLSPAFIGIALIIGDLAALSTLYITHIWTGIIQSHKIQNWHIRAFSAFLLGVILSYISYIAEPYIRKSFGEPYSLFGTAPGVITPGAFALLLVGGIVIAPVFEEIFFRAYAYGSMEKKHRSRALILSSLLFAIAHFDLPVVLIIFALGILLCYIYDWGGIHSAIALHSGFNTFALLYTYLGP